MQHDTTLSSVADDVATLTRKMDRLLGDGRYETRLLLQNDRYRRDGVLTKPKFVRICRLLKELNQTLDKQPGFLPFQLPKNSEETAESDNGAYYYFSRFYGTSLRQPKPFRPDTIVGYRLPKDPDLFLDYLLTLTDKQATVSTYVPKLLETVSLQGVNQLSLETRLGNFIDQYVLFVLKMRPALPSLNSVSTICAGPLLQHLLLPMVRHALVAPRAETGLTSFVGIQDLPTKITMHLRDGVQKAWKSLFTGVDQHDYDLVSDGPKLKVLEMLLESLDNHDDLSLALRELYNALEAVPGMGSKNASVLVLLMYAVTHYLLRSFFMHLITSGDRIITGSDFDTVVDADAGLRALMDRPSAKLIVKPEDDPELFLSFAQKAYVKVIALHWRQIKQQWPFMNLEQKKRLREAVQTKINERLAFDRVLMDKKKNKGDAARSPSKQELNNFEFYEL